MPGKALLARLHARARPIMAVVEVEGGRDFRTAICGTTLAGREARDDLTSGIAAAEPVVGLYLAALQRAVVERRLPVLVSHPPHRDRLLGHWQRLIVPLTGDDGTVRRLVIGATAEDPLGRALDALPAAVLLLDVWGRVRLANPAAELLFGAAVTALMGSSVRNLVRADSRSVGAQRRGRESSRRAVAVRADGTKVPIELSTRSTVLLGRRHRLMLLRDVSDEQARAVALFRLARTDELTGLANRRALHDGLTQAIDRVARHRGLIALHLLDLDGFKQINDRFGHCAGDMALKAFAARLLPAVRASDILARLGGDEFALLQPDLATSAGARIAAERLLSRLRDPLWVGGHEVRLRASIGTALLPMHAATAEELLEQADRALYRAKADGGGRATTIGDTQQAL